MYHVDTESLQGRLTFNHRRSSKRSTASENPTNSTFAFTHTDLQALRVEYHAPPTWHSLTANSERRRETVHFRLTADGVQPAYDSLDLVIAEAKPTAGSIQDGGEGHVTSTGNRSTLFAAALTSALAVTAVIVAVVAVVLLVFRRRRPKTSAVKQPPSPGVAARETGREVGDQLPEVVLVAVSNLPPPNSAAPPAGIVRQPIAVDWSNVDPEILQHCRTTDPILHSEKVWV